MRLRFRVFRKYSFIFLLIAVSTNGFSQTNKDSFTIGIAESVATMLTDSTSEFKNLEYDCYNRLTITDTIYDGFPSSHLNIFSEDGFNTIMPMMPGIWGYSEYRLKTYLMLAKKFDLQVIPFTASWFVPFTKLHNGNGINVYDNNLAVNPLFFNNKKGYDDPYQNCKARANYEFLFEHVFCDSTLIDVVRGYHLGGELNHVHLFNSGIEMASFSADYMYSREIPPKNVNAATSWFNEKKIGNQKTYISYVNHGASINLETDDAEYNGKTYQNAPIDYNVGDYLNLTNLPDVALEDSYFRWTNRMDKDWLNQPYSNISNAGPTCDLPETCNRHYLAKFKNIDFLKGIFKEVNATFTFETYWSYDGQNFYDEHYNSTKVDNANFMWFQVYTSIIHNVDGIIFYGLDSYRLDEFDKKKIFNNSLNEDRFERKYRSDIYNRFTANISKELRYLSNNGFLSPSSNVVLYQKQDYVDSNGIIPPADDYIPNRLPNEKETENYGLRYTIRENALGEVIMIISNPLNVKIKAELDFSKIENSTIQSANGVEYLFQSDSSVNGRKYKTDRKSGVDLVENIIELTNIVEFNSTEKLKLKLGPLDVLVVKFISN